MKKYSTCTVEYYLQLQGTIQQ